ncbi:DUF4870 domain-containing protein [candidate division KSB1 bacterium]|nr:MAG: DUF4870 domain-containing protein [candidate division KSB1 bacterium]
MVQNNTDKSRSWAMLCHLSALSIFVGIPFGNIIIPLIIWLLKKDESELIDANGKESINFQITFTMVLIITGILCMLVIGFIFLPVVLIADLVFVIQATIKTNEGTEYKYPYSIHFIQ